MSEITVKRIGSANGARSPENVDRIVLRRMENDRLQSWTVSLNERFDGMIRVTKSDLANFLIRQHAENLSEPEIKLIEAELFDEVRWLNWALTKVRQAKKAGQALSLNDLMVKRDTIRRQTDTSSKKIQRQRRTPVNSVGVRAEMPDPNED